MSTFTYNAVLREQLITNFIKEKPSRKQLIYNYFYNDDRSNNDLLNEEFKRYFLKIRLIKYAVTLYENFSTYYRTTLLKKSNREPLVLDQPLVDDGATNVIETLSDHSDEVKYCLDAPERGFRGIISNEKTLREIEDLSELQRLILWGSVIQGKSLKDISDQLGVSVQNVSQIKIRTILRLRGGLIE